MSAVSGEICMKVIKKGKYFLLFFVPLRVEGEVHIQSIFTPFLSEAAKKVLNGPAIKRRTFFCDFPLEWALVGLEEVQWDRLENLWVVIIGR